jgi:hypothetical protein
VTANVVRSDLGSTTMSFIGGSDPAEPSATDTPAADDTWPTAETFGEPTIADLTQNLAGFFATDIPEPSVLAGLAAWTSSENPANFLLTHDLPI